MFLTKKKKIFTLFVFCFFSSILFWIVSKQLQAQNNENQNNQALNKKQEPSRADHITGTLEDERFNVKNFSLMQRFHPSGKGEVLEVLFDIENITIYPLNLKFFIIAFHEKNAIDPQYRKRVTYPTWRKLDFEKEKISIVLLDSIPKINKQDIDPTKKELYKFPGFLDYVKYIERKPETGITFKIGGIDNSPTGEAQDGDSYSITEARLKTSIKGYLYIPYSIRHYNFNHVGVILYDTDKKQTVYRQFYRLTGHLKIF